MEIKISMHRAVSLIESMKKSQTIIVISHDYEFFRNVADRIVYLADKGVRDSFYLEKEKVGRLNEIFKEMEAYYDE